ncbi:hypothetical protein WBP07_20310 (plasmid) [Novosphingobium sp. BL-8A]|uniref:hypothetical protein n=1 Tax=Novosphingobium sp. BL-8A TaxID=3127639 RepID=UPI0037577554
MSATVASVGVIARPLLVGVLALAGLSQLAAINNDLLAAAGSKHAPARADLQARLAQTPYDQAALRGLASADRQNGNATSAHALLTLAGRLGWRDSQTELMLLEDAVRQGDANAAMRHIDALLRRKPDLAPRLMPALHAMATDKVGRNALLVRLESSPPWRKEFFTRIDFIPAQYQAVHETLLSELAKTGKPAGAEEISSYVAALARQGEVGRARKLWTTLTDTKPGLVLDPEFERFDPGSSVPAPSPFEWNASRLPGTELRITVEAGTPSSRDLVVDTDGSAHGTVLAQALVLKPGRYRLFVATPSTTVLAAGGLKWTVRCLPGSKTISTGGAAVALGWQSDFEVPAMGCAVQRLSLEARRADALTVGEARFEKVWALPLAGSGGPLS